MELLSNGLTVTFEDDTRTIFCKSVSTDVKTEQYDEFILLLDMWWKKSKDTNSQFSLSCDFTENLPETYTSFVRKLLYFFSKLPSDDTNLLVCTSLMLSPKLATSVDWFLSLYTPKRPFKICSTYDEMRAFIAENNRLFLSK